MTTLSFKLSVLLGKATIKIMRLFNYNATQLPGRISQRICNNFLDQITTKARVIGITGTNGKTTTTHLISQFLQDQGYQVISNPLGSNVAAGVISALLEHVNLKGDIKSDYIVLEIDERASIRILPHLFVDDLLINNLFRDSYNRNAHPDFIKGILEKAIDDRTHLILNADDLLSFDIKKDNPRTYFSLSANPDQSGFESNVVDVRNCPNCSHPLETVFHRYHHIGSYRCPNCGFHNPQAEFELYALNLEEKEAQIKIASRKESFAIPLIGDNETDAYNELAAATLLWELGFSLEDLQVGFKNLRVPSSRFESKNIGHLTVQAFLAKGSNPIASSRVFNHIARQEDQNIAVIFANTEVGQLIDEDYDIENNFVSENIGWLYEIDMEYLRADQVKQIIFTGRRRLDLIARSELAGIDQDKVFSCPDPKDGAKLVDLDQVDHVYILFDIFTKAYANVAFDVLQERIEHDH